MFDPKLFHLPHLRLSEGHKSAVVELAHVYQVQFFSRQNGSSSSDACLNGIYRHQALPRGQSNPDILRHVETVLAVTKTTIPLPTPYDLVCGRCATEIYIFVHIPHRR